MTCQNNFRKLLILLSLLFSLRADEPCKNPGEFYKVPVNSYVKFCVISEYDFVKRADDSKDIFAQTFFKDSEKIICSDNFAPCAEVECVFEHDEEYDFSKVCISSGGHYSTIQKFCAAKIQNPSLSYKVCGTESCNKDEVPKCFEYEVNVCKERIKHEGPVCGCDGRRFEDHDSFCTAFVSEEFMPIDFFFKNPCSPPTSEQNEDDFLLNYLRDYGNGYCQLDMNVYMMTSVENNDCFMEYSEYYYRIIDHSFAGEVLSTVTKRPDDVKECCYTECTFKISESKGGCGSDEVFYEDRESFCSAFCENRSLTLQRCGEGSCNFQNFMQCESECEAEAPDVPVCGNDGNLYQDKKALCREMNDPKSPLTDFHVCLDRENGCENCQIANCVRDELRNRGYFENTVCDSLGFFHSTPDSYCSAMENNRDEFTFILCDGKPCAGDHECAIQACKERFNHLEYGVCALFGSGFLPYLRYFNDTNDFCDNLFMRDGLLNVFRMNNIYECEDEECDEHLCALKNCEFLGRILPSICDRDTFELLTGTDVCKKYEIEGQENLMFCKDEDNDIISCSQGDCDARRCEHFISEVTKFNGDFLCTENGKKIPPEAYCEISSVVNGELFPKLLCDKKGDCFSNSDNDCCVKSCIQTRFKEISFQPGCNAEKFEYHNTVEEYCQATCHHENKEENTLGTVLEMATHSYNFNTLLNKNECCVARCRISNLPFCIKDDGADNYSLIDTTEKCEDFCDTTNNDFKVCDGPCTETDCQHLTCMEFSPGIVETGYCVVHEDFTTTFFDNKIDFCSDIINPDTISMPIGCRGEECTSQQSCDYHRCIISGDFDRVVCGDSGKIYHNENEYCRGLMSEETFNGSGTPMSCCMDDCMGKHQDNLILDVDHLTMVDSETYCIATCSFKYTGSTNVYPNATFCYDEENNLRSCTPEDGYKLYCKYELNTLFQEKSAFCGLFEGTIYFAETKEQWCEANSVENIDSSYMETYNFIPCVDCSEQDCCKRKCVTDMPPRPTSCARSENEEFSLFTHEAFCDIYCDSEATQPTQIKMCMAGVQPCTMEDCTRMQCVDDLRELFPSDICLENKDRTRSVYFTNVGELCGNISQGNFEGDYDFKSKEIRSSDGSVLSTSEDCCYQFCLFNDPATPKGGYCDIKDNFSSMSADYYCLDKCTSPNYELPNVITKCKAGECDALNCKLEQCSISLEKLFERKQCYYKDDENVFEFEETVNRNKLTGELEGLCPYVINELQSDNPDFNRSNLYDFNTITWGLKGSNQDCCIGYCMNYLNKKDSCDENYKFITKLDQCRSHCNKKIAFYYNLDTLHGCSNKDCEERDCQVKKCLFMIEETNREKEVCFNEEIEGKHFNSLEQFCIREIENQGDESDSFVEAYSNIHNGCSNVNEEGECMTKQECCTQRCVQAGEGFDTCHKESFELVSFKERCEYNCNFPETPLNEIDLISCDGEDCTINTCRIKRCVDELSRAPNSQENKFCTVDKTFGKDTFENMNSYCENLIMNSPEELVTENFSLPGLIGIEEFEEYDHPCCVAKCSIEGFNNGCRGDNYSLVTTLDYCNDKCNNEMLPENNDEDINNNVYLYKLFECNERDCEAIDCQIKRCERDISGGFDSTICFENDQGVLEFHNTSKNYCEALVSQANENYPENYNSIVSLLNCKEGEPCIDMKECCYYKCVNNENLRSYCNSGSDFNFITKEAICLSQCNGEPEPQKAYCTENGVEVECSQSKCEVERCKTTNSEHTDSICISQNWNGRDAFYSNVENFCIKMVENNITDFTLDPADLTVLESMACCSNRCDSDSNNYNATCGANFEVVEGSVFCMDSCLNNTVQRFDCGENDCTVSDCLYKKCRADNQSISTVCKEGTFYESVEDYCRDNYPEINNTHTSSDDFSISGNILCETRDCSSAQQCESQFCVNGISSNSPACDADTYDFVPNAAAKCDILKTNPTKQFVPCTDAECTESLCRVQQCKDTLPPFLQGASKVCVLYQDFSDDYYNSIDEFCTDHSGIPNYPNMGAFLCTDESCTQEKCRQIVCSLQDGFQPVCSTGDYSFVSNIDTYCEQYEPNPSTFFNCVGGCQERDCAMKKCRDSIDHVFSNVCLIDPINQEDHSSYYFEDVDSYCGYLKDTLNRTEFELKGQMALNLTGELPTDRFDCCRERCMSREYKNGCSLSGDTQGPVDQELYCNAICDGDHDYLERFSFCTDESLMTDPTDIHRSENAIEDCRETDCIVKSIALTYKTGNPDLEVLCGDDGNMYNSYIELATATYNDGVIGPLVDEGGPITDPAVCSFMRCLFVHSEFTGGCSVTDFTYLPGPTELCESIRSGNEFKEYKIDDETASQTDCSIQFCVKNNLSYKKVCEGGSGLLITLEESCKESVLSLNANFTSCTDEQNNPRDCEQIDCQKQRCLEQLSDIPTEESFCGQDDNTYTKETYCDSFHESNFHDVVRCPSGCSDSTACVVEKCLMDNPQLSFPTCSLEFSAISTKREFCEAVAADSPPELLPKPSNPTINASKMDCCVVSCLNNPDNRTACLISSEPTLQTKEDYCVEICQNNSTRLHHCDTRDCEMDDCKYQSCLEQNALTFSGPAHICASDKNPYSDADSFCNAKNNKPTLHLVLCSGEICPPTADCCESTCQVQNPVDSYIPRCSENGTPLATRDEYCAAVCSDPEYTDLQCGDDLCTIGECCETFCNNQAYKAVCNDEDFSLLTQGQYCTIKCNNTNNGIYDGVVCDNLENGCTEDECTIRRCSDKIREEPAPICLTEPLGVGTDNESDIFFFQDHRSFCEEKVSIGDTVYAISNELMCEGDQACELKTDCCKKRCMDKSFNNKCEPSGYSLIEKEAYCDSHCAGDNLSDLIECEENGITVSCSQDSCNKRGCEDTLNYGAGSFCSNVGILEEHFFNDIDSFCTAYTNEFGLTNIQNVSAVFCSESEGRCDSSSCCAARCSDPVSPFCASDGAVYNNTCQMNCINDTADVNSPCEGDLTVCENSCSLNVCLTGCDGLDYQPSCGSDGLIYDNSCKADCHGGNSFECTTDRLGNFRMINCQFKCLKMSGMTQEPTEPIEP